VASTGANWQQPFLEQLSLLHLLSHAVERFDELSDAIRADVEAVLGISTAADALAELPAASDCWQVVAQEVELDDRIRVQRTWMYGATVERAALVLQFAHGTSAFEALPSPGSEFTGALVFYPGSNGRAAVRQASAERIFMTKFVKAARSGLKSAGYTRARLKSWRRLGAMPRALALDARPS
jgi:hypothetical protein